METVRKGYLRLRPRMGSEHLILLVSLFLALAANTAFWRGLLAGRSAHDWHSWTFAAAMLALLAALQFILIAPLAARRMLRPLLGVVVVVSLLADHYMARYGIVLDVSMLRNVFHTDAREAFELISVGAIVTFLAGIGIAAIIAWVDVEPRSWARALRLRAGSLLLALFVLLGALLCVFQDFGSLMRNERTLRYAINPAGLVWSLGNLAVADARAFNTRRDPPEPVQRIQRAGGIKSRLLVMVVGETARAASFGLNGYARMTTPELARLDIVNFPYAYACGSSTEVSLPCMFSPFGRTDYDESRIRSHESLLHVLSRAGYRVIWLDNQSGCKGVCDGLDVRDLSRSTQPNLCADGRCFDEILTRELEQIVQRGTGDTVVVLHQLGNHGPAYFRRYPASAKRFAPACEHEDLRHCSREEIVNAYDNAIAYTDHFLADVIRRLDALSERYDVAMVYASDHGESLGEKGLYLHGMPYAIAPEEQLHVPMLWWLPSATAASMGFDARCFRETAAGRVSHDHLYHTIMGMLGVWTSRYHPERDLTSACRRRAA